MKLIFTLQRQYMTNEERSECFTQKYITYPICPTTSLFEILSSKIQCSPQKDRSEVNLIMYLRYLNIKPYLNTKEMWGKRVKNKMKKESIQRRSVVATTFHVNIGISKVHNKNKRYRRKQKGKCLITKLMPIFHLCLPAAIEPMSHATQNPSSKQIYPHW